MNTMSKRSFVFASLLLWTVTLSGCGDDLPRPALIADLRVLGIRAEPPEGKTGTELAIDVLAMRPPGHPPPEMHWFACVGASAAACGQDPRAFAVAGPCDGSGASQPVCDLGSQHAPHYRLPSLERSGGSEQGKTESKPGLVALLLVVADPDKGGIGGCLLDAMETRSAPDYCRLAFKLVHVLPSDAPAANANPGLTDFSHANQGQVNPGQTIDVSVALAHDAVETYDAQVIRDGERVSEKTDEILYLTWVATGGTIENFHTDGDETGLVNAWEAPTSPGTYTLAAILRDGRGGLSFRTADYDVKTP
jgi:hypothetical protein